MSARLATFAVVIAIASCARKPAPRLPRGSFTAVSGAVDHLVVADVVLRSRATVITFFSAHCACQKAHDARLRDLYERYAASNVAVIAVDSDADSSLDDDRREARERGYPFPLLADPDGAIADALGAEIATYSVVLDERGRIRYRGGFDSDRSSLSPDAKPYVADAVEHLLRGEAPDPVEAKSLGCSIKRR